MTHFESSSNPAPARCRAVGLHFAVLAGLMAVGCVHPAPPAAQYSGSESLVVSNANPDPLCYLYITDASRRDWGDNWIASRGLLGAKIHPIASNASTEWKIRAGKYKVRAAGCEVKDSAMNPRASGDGSTEAIETVPYPAFANQGVAFEVTGATHLVLHPATVPTSKVRDGYALADAPVNYARRLNADDLYQLAGGNCTQACRDRWSVCVQQHPKADAQCKSEQDRCETRCR